MAWDDPAPARGSRPATSRSQSPGYGADNRLPFLTIVGRGVVALLLGVGAYVGTHALLVAWHVAHRGGPSAPTAMAMSGLVAVVIGVLALRHLMSRPRFSGLPLRVRDGGGWWWSRRRGWDDGYGYPTFGQQVAAEIAVDVVDAAIDAIID
jgi:hypothetical protein